LDVLLVAMFALFCWAAWHRASPICPNCRRNIRTCPAAYCQVCGAPLNRKRCDQCCVDESFGGLLFSYANIGNLRWIVHCPGCGVLLETKTRRWHGR
jgi:predicted amidophosphoribosyltransferase